MVASKSESPAIKFPVKVAPSFTLIEAAELVGASLTAVIVIVTLPSEEALESGLVLMVVVSSVAVKLKVSVAGCSAVSYTHLTLPTT